MTITSTTVEAFDHLAMILDETLGDADFFEQIDFPVRGVTRNTLGKVVSRAMVGALADELKSFEVDTVSAFDAWQLASDAQCAAWEAEDAARVGPAPVLPSGI
jgi:hypothetical protein